MATSQNGWPVHESSAKMVPLSWITGRVAPGSVHVIFDYLGRRFNSEVEPIVQAHSWGYAFRAVRGQTSGFSNHASGTAVDFNAPAHPLGTRGTFHPAQVTALRRILADLDGVVRWGGDYVNRADEMHFEIVTDAARTAELAAKLGAPAPPKPLTRGKFVDATIRKLQRRAKRQAEDKPKRARKFRKAAKRLMRIKPR